MPVRFSIRPGVGGRVAGSSNHYQPDEKALHAVAQAGIYPDPVGRPEESAFAKAQGKRGFLVGRCGDLSPPIPASRSAAKQPPLRSASFEQTSGESGKFHLSDCGVYRPSGLFVSMLFIGLWSDLAVMLGHKCTCGARLTARFASSRCRFTEGS